MSYLLKDLVIDRVDLVDAGANSEAYIELYKRKEMSDTMDIQEILSKMKPEHAEVIKAELEALNTVIKGKDDSLKEANDALAAANDELDVLKADGECECDGEEDEKGMCKACGKKKKDVCKGMPEAARQLFEKMRADKEKAEEELRKAKEKEVNEAAIAKAASFKAVPISQEALVRIIKNNDADTMELLSVVSNAIEKGLLNEVGKEAGGADAKTAWDKVEQMAKERSVKDAITIEKARTLVLREHPDLYTEYVEGGNK